jgi:hypothetical protein
MRTTRAVNPATERTDGPAAAPAAALPAARSGADLQHYLATQPPGQRRALAGALGNAALCRAAIMRVPDPNDPSGYADLESYLAGVTVMSDEGARQRWAEAHPEPAPAGPAIASIYRIDRATGRCTPITHAAARAELGMTQSAFDTAVGSSMVLILRNGRLSRSSQATVDQINDPSTAPAVIRAGLEKLQGDAARRGGGNFPADYYVEFSRAITEAALRRRRSDPDAAIDEVNEAYGTEDFAQGRAVLHVYEAIARSGESTGFDKVQHFIRSMSLQYNGTGITTDIAQYGKEIVYDEIPSWWGDDIGYDSTDMLANNRGQAYAMQLYRRYHPVRDVIYNPIDNAVREVNEFERNLEREIYKLYNVPFF